MSYLLDNINFDKHNEEVREVWDAYYSGKPIRVPVILGINPRIYLLNPELNTECISFQQYSQDPDLMAQVQMISQHYIRHNMLQDAEMGLPNSWNINVDLQNYYEAAWFGAEIEYRTGQVPDTRQLLTSDNKHMLFDRGIPDSIEGGAMKKAWQFYEHMNANKENYSYKGVPAGNIGMPGGGTDGPMTVAANLRGATEFCLELYEDPDYANELLNYITEATIARIKAYRKTLNMEMKPQVFWFADDSIELLSVDMYKEFILPYHKKLIQELAGEGPHWIHLCGDVDRLMPTIKEELNVNTWDAGFPMNYADMRDKLGEEFSIQTGPKVSLLINGTPEQVEMETRNILESGITRGGKFIMRDANNLSPLTPVKNVEAMYNATKRYGKY